MPNSPFPFLDWFNEQPEVGYYTLLGRAGGSPALQRYFQGQYGNIYNQYLGALGQQAMGGGLPEMRWTDFLNQTPFTSRYAALPASFRRGDSSALNPITRWLLSKGG